MKFCKEDILDYKPDAVIFIDYPGFNLRIAEFVHENKIPTLILCVTASMGLEVV